LVTAKLSKLERMLNHRAVSAQAVLSREKHSVRADITLHARGEKFLHGVGNADGWETSIGEAIAKISQQAERVKSKFTDRKRRGVRATAAVAEAGEAAAARPAGPARERIRMPRILRATRQTIRQMSVADATREIDANGDGLVIFRDVERRSVSVLYRHNGELTLVETEA
ncbi:MAG TPA: HPF/RaiA family ribosome-associated protein, partial [Vicinamibacterales bacterium]|nr:HPF/RaiA family ribosome-associated protein [Vicinamibacterales bacterium]